MPVISNLTGTWLRDEDALDPSYWARHMRGTVRFADSLSTLLADPARVLLEVGPGGGLTSLARLHPDARPGRLVLSAMPGTRGDREALLEAVGRLHCAGAAVDWSRLHAGERRRRVPLPTYAFERRPYLLPPAGVAEAPRREPASTTTNITSPTSGAPESLERKLATIWQDLLGVPHLSAAADFFALGGDSFLAMHLRRKVAEAFGVTLPAHFMLEHRTLGAMSEQLRAATSDARETEPSPPGLLVRLRQGAPDGRTLYLIQPAGGTVFSYAALAAALDPALTVYGVRASGLEPGEPVLPDVEAIAARYLEEIRGVQPRGPYLLGGHSAGGVIAFELARRMIAAGEAVDALLLLDAPALDDLGELKLDGTGDLLTGFSIFRETAAGARALIDAMQTDERLRDVILQTCRAVCGYVARPLRVPLLFTRPRIERETPAPRSERYWLERCAGHYATWVVPGDHFSMLERPNVTSLARVVDAYLATIEPEPAGSAGRSDDDAR
jgi:thioesterase domain-containing protein